MKRIFALIMTVVMCFSLFALAGCKKTEESDVLSGAQRYKEKYDYDAYIEEEADIIGEWKQQLDSSSEASECVWTFNDDTTIKITETLKGQGVKITTNGACNYNEKTGEINYMLLLNKTGNDGKLVSEIKEYDAKVSVDGNKMTFTYTDGTTTVFTK
ncbi:MAG: hypothetical protein E7566_04055 [Ruminococcaceae bacterium]|nr:hypothetical protein [Oscillospiraceae bacterium]